MGIPNLSRLFVIAVLTLPLTVANSQQVAPQAESESVTRMRREYLQQLAHQYSLTPPAQGGPFVLTKEALLF